MGLFDRIIYSTHCTICGEKLTEFQTRNTSNPALIAVPLPHVNSFYTECYCGAKTLFIRPKTDAEKRLHGEFVRITSHPTAPRRRHGHAGSSKA